MTISGNISSMSFAADQHARVEGDYRVLPGELEGDTKVWPRGLLLVKSSAATKWTPLSALPATGVWFLGVLDEDVDTTKAGSGMVVRFGGVKLSELKDGVDAQAAPSADFVHALEAHKIYAV